jgi:hypothetical protein
LEVLLGGDHQRRGVVGAQQQALVIAGRVEEVGDGAGVTCDRGHLGERVDPDFLRCDGLVAADG